MPVSSSSEYVSLMDAIICFQAFTVVLEKLMTVSKQYEEVGVDEPNHACCSIWFCQCVLVCDISLELKSLKAHEACGEGQSGKLEECR